jgi:uncharacterized protein YxeA
MGVRESAEEGLAKSKYVKLQFEEKGVRNLEKWRTCKASCYISGYCFNKF